MGLRVRKSITLAQGIKRNSYHKHKSEKVYKTLAYQKYDALQKQYETIEIAQERERNHMEVEQFENQLEMFKVIHLEAEEPINWIQMKNEPSPFKFGEHGPHEQAAMSALIAYAPSILGKMLGRSERKIARLKQQLEVAKKIDKELYAEWEQKVELAGRVAMGDTQAYLEVLDWMRPLEDLVRFGSSFEIFIESLRCLEVEFKINTEAVIPGEIKLLTSTEKVTTKAMPKSRYYDIQSEYVCHGAIRIARDLFALLPVQSIYIHGIDEKRTILSVRIDRQTLRQLDLAQLSALEMIAHFKHHMKFKKTQGFEAVSRLEIE